LKLQQHLGKVIQFLTVGFVVASGHLDITGDKYLSTRAPNDKCVISELKVREPLEELREG
jgi:hypothetical protein